MSKVNILIEKINVVRRELDNLEFAVKEFHTTRTELIVLLEACCGVMGLKIKDVVSESRKSELVDCRKAFSFLARGKLQATYQEIADVVNRDHSTVMSAESSIRDYVRQERERALPGGYYTNLIEKCIDRFEKKK